MTSGTPLRVVVVDDEELARRGIRRRLERLADVEIVAECGGGREAVEAVRRTAPDLVLLDVQMPGMSGFEVVEEIGWESFPPVIFITAHDQHAVRAFEIHALDYLLKPIDDERFDLALARARDALRRERDGDLRRRLAALLGERGQPAIDPAGPETRPARFVVRSGGRVVFVAAEEIDWIEAAGDYVRHAGRRTWLLRETMGGIEGKLDPARFARIHRAAIVNVERIGEMRPHDNGEYLVRLRDGTELKLSRSYRQSLQRLVDGRL
jgi:two-component system LytT family response regulator